MSCYAIARDFLGLSLDSQGSAGQWYLMLSMLDDLETGQPDTYPNPLKELLFRLAAYSETDAYRSLSQLIGGREHASVAPWQVV